VAAVSRKAVLGVVRGTSGKKRKKTTARKAPKGKLFLEWNLAGNKAVRKAKHRGGVLPAEGGEVGGTSTTWTVRLATGTMSSLQEETSGGGKKVKHLRGRPTIEEPGKREGISIKGCATLSVGRDENCAQN